MIKKITESNSSLVTQYELKTIFVSLNNDSNVVVLEGIEKEIFDSVFNAPNFEEGLAKYAENSEYDLESIRSFAVSLINELKSHNVIEIVK